MLGSTTRVKNLMRQKIKGSKVEIELEKTGRKWHLILYNELDDIYFQDTYDTKKEACIVINELCDKKYIVCE